MTRVGIAGITGRLGKQVLELLLDQPDMRVTAGIARPGNMHLGTDIAALVGRSKLIIPITDTLHNTACDVYVDCTHLEGLRHNLPQYAILRRPLIIATTGIDDETKASIEGLSRECPVVLCPNFSLGVYKFLKIVGEAARQLRHAETDIEILEAHNRLKKDCPSGTANAIVQQISAQQPDVASRVAVHSIRAGDIVAEHTVLFIMRDDSERIELSHRIGSRRTYAKGIVHSINWIAGRANGLYGIADIFGEDE
jgi:4-hydroxy-tetrahydrodipicolinate reductase